MGDERNPETQQTQPRGKEHGEAAEPVEIPVPSRKDVFGLMRAVAGKRSDAANDSSAEK